MQFHEHRQALDEKIKRIQNIEPFDCYVTDGIVNLDKWRLQKIRPLFIGKEAHGEGNGTSSWSIVNWLDEVPTEVCQYSPTSWQKTAYISYSLQNDFIPFDDIPWIRDDESVAEALRHIAFINIGKYTADTKTPWSRLNSLYNQNSSILFDQIALLQPNVVIGWNTLGLFENDPAFIKLFAPDGIAAQQQDYTRYWISNGKLFIAAYHPASMVKGLTQDIYVDGIIQIVKDNLHKLDTNLPQL